MSTAAAQIAKSQAKVIAEKPTYTFLEYLRKEEKSLQKHEYYNGNILLMAGAKARHNQIAVNVTSAIKYAVRPLPKQYIVYNSDQKIYIEPENKGVYPDALVICEEPEFWEGREDVIVNPLLIVEVLSRSTAQYDRMGKFMLYEKLPSFKEYILVEQTRPEVESWFRIAPQTWNKNIETNLTESIQLRSLNVSLPLAEIYEYVQFSLSNKLR